MAEGVFLRESAAHGQLIDRLMAKIADLEGRLYEKEEERNQLIAASWPAAASSGEARARASAPSGGSSLTAPIDTRLLGSLGDPEKQPEKRDWLAAVPSWLSKTTLARSSDPRAQDGRVGTRDSSTPRAADAAAAGAAGGGWTAAETSADGGATPATKHSRHSSVSAAAQGAAATEPPASASRGGSFVSSGQQQQLWSQQQQQQSWRSNLKHYYRYYLSAAEVDDETGDVTQRVQEAAGAALAEANERLMEAEKKVQAALAAQQHLQQQLAAAQQLSSEVEALKAENLKAWRVKYELEGQMAAYKAGLEDLQCQGSSMHKELEAMRAQGQIWADGASSEVQKLQAENGLLVGQLAERGAELAQLRAALTEAEAGRDRALQERKQAMEERDRLAAQVQQVSALQQQLVAAGDAAARASSAAAHWEEKFMRERAVRRKLHEQLQVLRGNIRVMCRVRPALQPSPGHHQPQTTAAAGSPSRGSSGSCISFPLEGLLSVHDVTTARQREFEFDAVFGPGASQQQVYEEVAPLVRSCADGYNVCIFAYGQTGSGKTHTMQGPGDDPGINTRALQELFAIAAEEQEGSWLFQVAMLEIYNESVRDLLALAAAAAAAAAAAGGGGSGSSNMSAAAAAAVATAGAGLDVSGLPTGELPAQMDRVPGLVWRPVSTVAQVHAVLREGSKARATAATALNAASSRSHALVSVKVAGKRDGRQFRAWLHLVDLAGSERVDKSEVAGQQLREAQAINKSLSALGDVIAALQRRGAHIPFRNSKLTQVLQDSLCGSSKVLLVCNLSPEASGETISSLNFASRAAQVELGQARRVPQQQPAAAAAGGWGSDASEASGNAAALEPAASAADAGAGSASGIVTSGSSSSRGSSPSPTKLGGAERLRSSVGSGLGPAAAAAGSGGSSRPSSRLSERAAAASGSPTKVMKPARH